MEERNKLLLCEKCNYQATNLKDLVFHYRNHNYHDDHLSPSLKVNVPIEESASQLLQSPPPPPPAKVDDIPIEEPSIPPQNSPSSSPSSPLPSSPLSPMQSIPTESKGCSSYLSTALDAPESTKLFFSNVPTVDAWNQLYKFYMRHFGNKRIKKNGTMYLRDKGIGYINFHKREDMLKGLQFTRWNPREGFQDLFAASGDVLPKYCAFATGFQDWKIAVMQPLAKQLLKAETVSLKEDPSRKGFCSGWGIVGFKTQQQLHEALKETQFVLKCKNRLVTIKLRPFRKDVKSQKLSTFQVRKREIKRWIEQGIISLELGEKYLNDVDNDQRAFLGSHKTQKKFKRNIPLHGNDDYYEEGVEKGVGEEEGEDEGVGEGEGEEKEEEIKEEIQNRASKYDYGDYNEDKEEEDYEEEDEEEEEEKRKEEMEKEKKKKVHMALTKHKDKSFPSEIMQNNNSEKKTSNEKEEDNQPPPGYSKSFNYYPRHDHHMSPHYRAPPVPPSPPQPPSPLHHMCPYMYPYQTQHPHHHQHHHHHQQQQQHQPNYWKPSGYCSRNDAAGKYQQYAQQYAHQQSHHAHQMQHAQHQANEYGQQAMNYARQFRQADELAQKQMFNLLRDSQKL